MRRQGDREARVEALDDRTDLLLVRRVHVRVDEADGQRFDSRLDEIANDALDLRLVDGHDGLAARPHSFDRLPRVGERGGWIGLDHDDPACERPWRLRAREMEDLLEPLCRDQTDARALRLEHGVRGDRRPVEDVAQLTDTDACLAADAL